MNKTDAILITAKLLDIAATAKRLVSPAIYTARVQVAKELITAVAADRKMTTLSATLFLMEQVDDSDETRMWLATAAVELNS